VADDLETPGAFSDEEVRQMRRLLRRPDTRPICPRCGSDFIIRGPVVASATTLGRVWHVHCAACDRKAFVSDIPSS
jgi:hypothetical protein